MKNRILKAGIIMMILAVAVLAMSGAGAAELVDLNASADESITLTYYEKQSDTSCSLETKTIPKEEYQAFFGTSRVWTFSTAADINAIAEKTQDKEWKHDVTYIQVADIDCAGLEMKSIPGKVYNFNIYGNGYTISNYSQTGNTAHGLVEKIGNIPDKKEADKYSCTFNKVSMTNSSITGNKDYVGALVGRNEGGKVLILGCSLKHSTVMTNGNYLGGFVGRNGDSGGDLYVFNSSVENCKIMAKNDYVGGILGDSWDDDTNLHLLSCKVTSTKIGGGEYIGGIGGYILDVIFEDYNILVDNCIIESYDGSVGGLFGCSRYGSTPVDSWDIPYMVKNTAILSSDSYAGVIAGDISNYWSWTRLSIYPFMVAAQNCIVCGTENIHINCPDSEFTTSTDPRTGEVDAGYTRVTHYIDGGIYYVGDSRESTSLIKTDLLTLYTDYGCVKCIYSDEIDEGVDKAFVLSEMDGTVDIQVSQVRLFERGTVVDLGPYGIKRGYGYYPLESYNVTYNLRKEYHMGGWQYVTSTKNCLGVIYEKLSEPVVDVPEGYVFSGWYKDPEYTQEWNFKTDVVKGPTTLYGKLTEKTFSIVYCSGVHIVYTHKEAGYNEEVTLYNLPSSSDKKFVGWNTKDKGSGVSYAGNEKVKGLADLAEKGEVTLYAMYEEIPKDVILYFVMNGHGSYKSPIMVNDDGSFSRPSNPVETGYTFKDWYKDEGCTQPFDFTGPYTTSKTAYAKWSENTYSIVFDGNWSTGQTMSPLTDIRYSEEKILPVNEFVRDGYTFAGWNTKADGSGESFNDKSAVSKLTSDDNGEVTLYAQWVENKMCTLSFEMNGHGNEIEPVISDTGTFTSPADPYEKGYTFGGWYYDLACTEGNEFNFNVSYITNATACAKWTESTYSIVFDSNQGSGSMNGIAGIPFLSDKILPENEFIRPGYRFVEWNTKADGSGSSYADKATVTGLSSADKDVITLYAQWAEAEKPVLSFNMNGHGNQVSSIIADSEGKFTVPTEPTKFKDEIEYDFGGWYKDEECTESFDFTAAYEDDQIAYAKWTENACPVYIWDGTKYVNVKDLQGSSLSGKVMFDETSRTLTLNGYTVDFTVKSDDEEGAIRSLIGDDLKIVLEGTNTIGSPDHPSLMGITLYGDVEISGNGKLTIYANATEEESLAIGIFSMGNITMNGGTIDIVLTPSGLTGEYLEAGIESLGGVTINGGTTTIQVMDNSNSCYGIFGNESVTITGGETTVAGGNVGIATGYGKDFTMTGGNLTSYNNNYGMDISGDIILNNMISGSFKLDALNCGIHENGEVATTLSDSMKIYAGWNSSNLTEITLTATYTFNDFIKEKYPCILISSSDSLPDIPAVTPVSTKDDTVSEGIITPAYLPSVMESTEISTSGNVITIGDKKITATSKPGYEFDSWDIDSSGEVTGDTTITAIFKNNTVPVESVVITGDSEINTGESTELSAIVYPLTATDKTVKWSSSNDKIATISQEGKVMGVSSGNVVITATAVFTYDGEIVKAEHTLRVRGNSDDPTHEKSSSSSITSFRGIKDGSDFTFNNAVVITNATLPGATSATIVNGGSGNGWYKFTLSTEGFTGNGTLYFQVPLDVIEIKGWTVNDVSLLGCKTTYLKTDGQYAKYSAVISKDGSYSIDFEKDAAAKVAEQKTVTETKKEDTTPITTTRDDSSSTTQKTTETVKTTATTEKTTTEQKQTATTKSPVPLFGILAGLGAAGVLIKRRKL